MIFVWYGKSLQLYSFAWGVQHFHRSLRLCSTICFLGILSKPDYNEKTLLGFFLSVPGLHVYLYWDNILTTEAFKYFLNSRSATHLAFLFVPKYCLHRALCLKQTAQLSFVFHLNNTKHNSSHVALHTNLDLRLSHVMNCRVFIEHTACSTAIETWWLNDGNVLICSYHHL